ncbi:YXWGXW repeat-containing protein [Bradyrhizobium erythrophlei]|jgi:hypothetical protein|nr:YXWGXW repeat-containing protein [Bradyrhizobium erythrophlei]
MRRFRLVIWILSALAAMAIPAASTAQIISITIAPPELPLYEQPEIPAPGYIWTPGYWAYGPDGYFWVPGTWVEPPAVGLLWTPGYWGWHDGNYGWNAGYWGSHIGFYGGVNYGYGYGGVGYEGGRWNNGVFAYNRTVNNFGGVSITNVYSQTVINNTNVTRTSFNGGTGGTTVQPTPQEQAAAHEQHVAPTAVQTQHQQTASTNRALLASENHGHPAIAATSRPAEFTGKGVVAAREAKPGPATAPITTPAGAKPLATNKPLETNKSLGTNKSPGANKPPENKPLETNRAPETNKPLGNKPLESNQQHTTLNNAAPAKPPKPAVTARPPKPAVAAVAAPQKPPPHAAAPTPAPHPVAAARPAPRPKAPPPKDEHH